MSNTHVIKMRRKIHRIYKKRREEWSANVDKFERGGYPIYEAIKLANMVEGQDVYTCLSGEDYNRITANYNKNPSSHNKLTFHKPLRRRVRDKLKVQTLEADEDLQLDFKNKPMDYYW